MKTHRVFLLLALLAVVGCCSGCGIFGEDKLPADEVGQAAFVQKQTIEVAKRNRDRNYEKYDAELRTRYEEQWTTYFGSELKSLEQNQKLTPGQIAGLYKLIADERAAVFAKLDMRLAQMKSDDSLDQCAALADIQIVFARQVSATYEKFHQLATTFGAGAESRKATP